MASVPPEGGGFQVRAGLRIPLRGELSLGAAQTMGRDGLIAARRPSPSAAGGGGASLGPGRPAVAARRLPLPPGFLPSTPWPPGKARLAEKLGGVAAAATRAAGPGKQRGDVCGLKSGNRAPVGAGRAHLAPPAHCLPSAHPHALNKKLTHPAPLICPSPAQQTAGSFRMGTAFNVMTRPNSISGPSQNASSFGHSP